MQEHPRRRSVASSLGLALPFALLAAAHVTRAQSTTSFSYQGRLNENGSPASGAYDFQFTLWDAVNGGQQQPQPSPPTLTATNVTVAGGTFTVTLDFGLGGFPGPARFLQAAVRHAGVGGYTTLLPRQQLQAVPYAISCQWMPSPLIPISYTAAYDRGALLSAVNTAAGGVGVYGEAHAAQGFSGPSPGVSGSSPDGSGVYGLSSTGNGVSGESASGPGVSGTSSSGAGVKGSSTSGNGAEGTSTGGHGVRGSSTNGSYAGVYGLHSTFIGVWGDTTSGTGVSGTSSSGTGVYGTTTSGNAAVYGNTVTQIGVQGISQSGTGVRGTSTSGTAVYAQTAASGTGSAVYAYNTAGGRGLWSYSPSGIGVEGQSGSSYGVYGYSTSSYAGYFDGSIYVSGNIVNPSDAALKTDVETLPYGLEDLMRIQPVAWRWADGGGGPRFGVIAQDLEKVLPELVVRECDPDRPLAVDYTGLVPVVIRALQEEVRQKDAAIRSLEERLRAVEAAVSTGRR